MIAALIWFIPDTRIEKRLAMQNGLSLATGGESARRDENPGKNRNPNLHPR